MHEIQDATSQSHPHGAIFLFRYRTRYGAATYIELQDRLAQYARERSGTRRDFLRALSRASAATSLLSFSPMRAALIPRGIKTVVVTFGGGARDEETFAPEGQRCIPHLLTQLIPEATFYTQVVNRGILGHYVANASLATGCYETFDNFTPVAPEHPTLFEYFRRDLRRPATDAWVIAPSNGFQHIGESQHPLFGLGSGATVVLPKQLLGLHSNTSEYEHLLRDNYESPLAVPLQSASTSSIQSLASLMQISVTDFLAHARAASSPDELSLYIAAHVMEQLGPTLLWITLHDIDIAHSGAFSLYTDAIVRTDRICGAIWDTIQRLPEYKGRTNLFILPDFGRDGDTDPGGNGFQHHRTGDALSRTTWLMALGPDIRENFVVDRPVESIDLVPTLASILGCNARFAQGHPLHEVL
jgi:hypothetical protein